MPAISLLLKSSPCHWLEDRPCYSQRQPEDRPCYSQRQAEDRPCYSQRQVEDRPCYSQRQAEDRAGYSQCQPEDRPCYSQRQPRETTSYTQLQPVVARDLSFGALITSSTSVCLREDLAESSCLSDPVGSSCQPPPPLSRYEEALPVARTPESVDEEELTTLPEALQTGMTGIKGDDDDSSVMIDHTDLTFLDQFSMNEDSTGSSTWHDDPPLPSAAHLPGHHSSTTPYSPALQYHHHYYYVSSSSSSTASFNSTYSEAPIRAPTTPYKSSRYAPHHPAPAPTPIPTLLPWALHYHDTPSIIHHERAPSSFPPTPSPSPSQLLRDAKTCRDPPHAHPHHHHHHPHHHHHHPPAPPALHSLSAMSTNDVGDVDNDIDDDDDPVYKPYCESRRGAKKNLLWKFLLTVLDSRSDLAQWTDLKKGVFKFVDTGSISKLWGQRKHKNDMTFEKLSRGIRHYYKRGLMERMSNTRLVYKFNWDKVPKKFRKA